MNMAPKIIELKGDDPETAFHETQREARHALGHNGQTGTIADADGCIIVQGPELLPWDCRRAAQQVLREGHAKQNGPVFIIRLADPAKTKTVRSMVDVTGMTPGQADDAIDAAVRQKLADGWGIVNIEARGADAEGDDRKGTLKTKTTITPGTGKRITRYAVRNQKHTAILIEKDTLAEAKAWMKEALATDHAPMDCVAVTRKESGALLTGQTTIVKQALAITATIGTAVPGGNGTYLAAGVFTAP